MRYCLITYVRRPNGQWDETVEVTRNLRRSDRQMKSVIMDFKDCKILKAHVPSQAITLRDWDTIHNYYHQHYENIFERLHFENGRTPVEINESTQSVGTATNTAA